MLTGRSAVLLTTAKTKIASQPDTFLPFTKLPNLALSSLFFVADRAGLHTHRSQPHFMQNGLAAPTQRPVAPGGHSSQGTMTREPLASSATSSLRSAETCTRQTFGSRRRSL